MLLSSIFFAAVVAAKPRVFVLTDIANEPDDAMSLTRFLLYSNEFSVQGICATTSVWLPNETHIEQIQQHIASYAEIVDNLNVHVAQDAQYPSAEELMSKTYAGYPAYGVDAVGAGKSSNGSTALMQAVAASDEEIWVTIWGGANVLAQAVWEYEQSQSAQEVENFIAKLRVYSISDQDDAGAWLRHRHNSIFWILSVHGMNLYTIATWVGISGEGFYPFDAGGPDSSLVTNEWLDTNIRDVSPFGSTYPDFEFIMEGDTPTFLSLIQNGLNVVGKPRWGGWGGRYARISRFDNLWVNAFDSDVVGQNGGNFTSSQATIWRWRNAYQWDFSGRMRWSATDKFSAVNHNPIVVVNGSSTVADPLYLTVNPGDVILLDAGATHDPDGDELATVSFWQYLDVSQFQQSPLATPTLTIAQTGLSATVTVPSLAEFTGTWAAWMSGRGANENDTSLHVIAEVWDDGVPSLVGYKRVVLTVQF
ncbi:Cellulose-binding protein [Mycena venus]|uniref:Cellulose-binding protein n=1 Tax=Mycena venus TaxID=2733690 RepID=A0A8H6WSV3_9AGAR|nr:Cellulose-binding protein [Mycena venus]